MRKRNRKQMAWLLSISLTMTSLGAFPGSLALADSPSVTTISDKADFLAAVTNMREANTGRKAKYRLTGNITLDAEDVLEPVEIFEGELDGAGYSITGLRVQKDGKPAALFTTLQNSAKIKNIKFEHVDSADFSTVAVGLLVKKLQGKSEITDVTIKDSKIKIDGSNLDVKPSVSSVGLLAEEMTGEAKVSNVKIEGSAIETEGTASVSAVGLLAGKVQGDVVIEEVSADAGSFVKVEDASSEIGGILGTISGKRIRNCENHAAVTCEKGEMVGGIVGHVSSASVVSCENDGSITGGKCVGGITGKSEGSGASLTGVMNKGTIEAKIAAEVVDADAGKNVGGIAGEAGGEILHAGNTGDVKSSISANSYVADSGTNPNPYIGGIVGKGSSLTIENSYTAANIGDLTADDLNEGGKVLNLYSTAGAGVTVKHSYFLALAENNYGEVTGATAEDFRQGKVAAELCSYQPEGNQSSSRTYWRQKIGTDDYPGSYHKGNANEGKIVFVNFNLAANIGQAGVENPYSDSGEFVNYGADFSDLSFYQSVVLTLSAGSVIFKIEGNWYREVTATTKIRKDVVFYVWKNDGSSGGTAPDLMPADEDPEAAGEPETSEDPWETGASATPDVSATPEASGTPKPSAPVWSWWYPGYPVVPSPDATAAPVPTESGVPEDLTLPETSNAPEKTAVPAESGAPDVTAVPEESGVPAASDAPEASAAPAESSAPSDANTPAEDLKDPEAPEDQDPLEKGEKVESNGAVFTASGTNSIVMEKNTDPDIQSATVPDTVKAGGVKYKVTAVSEGAFADCKNLKTVNLGKNVKKLGAGCFKNCTNLKTVKFPKNLKTVSESAFQNCRKLKSAALPASTKKIGKACFKNCRAMTKFSIGNVTKKKKGGMQLAENGNVMAGGTPITISIAASALENCVNLKQVIINSQVQKIGNAAFRQCKALSKIIVYSLILKKVGKQALTGVHNCKISVPVKKVKPYKVLFKNKGQGKKVVVAKM